MKEGVTLDRWWIDKSVESECGPGKVELETDIPEGMTRLDQLIKIAENPADMFKSVIDPLQRQCPAGSGHVTRRDYHVATV